MKQFLLLLLPAILITSKISAQAQPGDQHALIVRSLLQKQAQLPGNQKTTAVHYRLVAAKTKNSTFLDSTHYYYSGGRGSTYTTEKDDRSANYSDGQFSALMDPAEQDIRCDSSKRFYNSTSAIKRRYSYNSSNLLVQLEEYQSNTRFEYFYNANGDRDSIIKYSMTTGARLSKRSYTYDNQQRLTEEYEATPDQQPVNKSVYSYSPIGSITVTNYGHTPTWEPTSYSKYHFDNNNRLVRAETYSVTGGQTSYGNADSFTYTGNITQPVRHGYYQYTPPMYWQLISYEEHHLNAQNLIDTIHAYTTGQVGYDTLELQVLHYFNNSQVDDVSVYKYTAGQYATVPYRTQHRYYEEYFPTSVTQVAGKKNEVVVYPNPIRDQVNIRTDIPSGTVTIHNMLGQAVFTKQFPKLNGSSIDMNANPAGQYILRISGNAGEILHTSQFIKR